MLQNARVKAFIFFELRESQQGGVKITPIPHTHTHKHTQTHTHTHTHKHTHTHTHTHRTLREW